MNEPFTHPEIVKSYGDADGRGKTHILKNGWRIDVLRSGGRFGLVSLDIVSPAGEEFRGVFSSHLPQEVLPGGVRYVKCAFPELNPVADIAFGLIHSSEFQ